MKVAHIKNLAMINELKSFFTYSDDTIDILWHYFTQKSTSYNSLDTRGLPGCFLRLFFLTVHFLDIYKRRRLAPRNSRGHLYLEPGPVSGFLSWRHHGIINATPRASRHRCLRMHVCMREKVTHTHTHKHNQ